MHRFVGLFSVVVAFVALLCAVAVSTAVGAPNERRTSCPTAPWNQLEVAHEIIDIGTVYTRPKEPLPTYKGAGDNPISDSAWNAGYAPPQPYIANTTRNLQFNESQFIASPGEPICSTAYIATSDGYTWAAMSMAVNAMWPYDSASYSGLPSRSPFYAGNLVETPPPGVVKVTANFKAQNMKFWANEDGVAPGTSGAVPLTRYFVRDKWGNEYVMHASGKDTPAEVAQAFEDAILPDGWQKITRTLDRDLVLRPAEGADGSFHYLVFRDSADNTYHQSKWGKRGALQAQVEGTGMPIWGGESDDRLKGQPGSDLIHGAGGDDRIRPRWGEDEVWGDAGRDAVVLRGKARRYRLISLNGDRTRLTVKGYGARKKLRFVEQLQFGNRRVEVDSLRDSDVGERF